MKRFIFMTAILLGLLWWFGLPSAKDSSSKQDAPYSFTSTSSSYQPWSNSLEKVHRMIYLREARSRSLRRHRPFSAASGSYDGRSKILLPRRF